MRFTESEIFSSLDEADDFAEEGWPDNEDVVAESAWETEEAADWEGYPADEIDEEFADESIAIENYADTEYDEQTTDFGEIDAYHASRRRHRPQPQRGTTKTGPALAAAIAQTAEQEYRRWQPSLKERDAAATPILQEYYRTGVGMNVSASQLQSESWQKGHPWSAVFISWVMKKAGAGSAFAYSAAHQNYIRAARRNRLTNNTANPFWAFRATEFIPQAGDLVCTARDNSGATYDNIADPQSRKTHCDIVTAVRPGKLRVVGGNVRQNVDEKVILTQPDGRLRLDGKQSGYFAVIRCNDASVPVPPAPQPQPRPGPGPSPQVSAGQVVIDREALLRSHAGTPPDLVLKWNDMSRPSVVDVVVHLHGWSPGVGARMNIVRHKLPASGLDFADPKNPGSVGRTTPTLLILPRGHHDPVGSKTERYTFPALINRGALQRLVDESLTRFAAQTGATVRRGRLILTAHSGGGAALMKILGHTDPDEVHTFDALYTDPTPLIAWAQRKISSSTGALRVVYRPGEGTEAHSKRVARAISSSRSRSFRVEPTNVSHGDIPARFGWQLLADPSSDLPGVRLSREAGDQLDQLDYDEADFVSEAEEADFACAQITEALDESDWEEDYPVGEFTDEYQLGTELLDEFDEDHAEDAALHAAIADEFHDSEALAEMIDAEYVDRWHEAPRWRLKDDVFVPEREAPYAYQEFDDEDVAAVTPGQADQWEWEEGEPYHGEVIADFESAENDTEEVDLEEFGGDEHKAIGDRASGNVPTDIMYGSPPRPLSFGDVVALAGDYFDSYSELVDCARTPEGRIQLAWARWKCLGLDASEEPPADAKHRKAVQDRYFLLASQNLSHFSAGGTARDTYKKRHTVALQDALEAGQTSSQVLWRRALAKEAFADHFLTDMFSAGHVRTPRASIEQWYGRNMPGADRRLVRFMAQFIYDKLLQGGKNPGLLEAGLQVVESISGYVTRRVREKIRELGGEAINSFSLADIVSLAIHDYDNRGLDVVSDVDASGHRRSGPYRWRALGDGHLGVGRPAPPRQRTSPCVTSPAYAAAIRSQQLAHPCTRAAYSPASGLTTSMATAAVIASLRDLERVRGIGVRLGRKPLSQAQRVQAIMEGTGKSGYAALQFVPREDVNSRRNVPLVQTGSTPSRLDWRWGQLGDLAYGEMDGIVRCRIAAELEDMIEDIDDKVTFTLPGGAATITVVGVKGAMCEFVAHLRTYGIWAIEKAVEKRARPPERAKPVRP